MKTILFPLFFLLAVSDIIAQTVEEISMGNLYAHQTFYSFENASSQTLAHSDWHIAFSVHGVQDAGIFINEGASLMEAGVQLFAAPTNNFSDVITLPLSTREYGNTETNWNEGAFNAGKNPADFTDLGWGVYNPVTHAIVGNRVFVLLLPNGDSKKIQIDSLVMGTYYFHYADLDGANQVSATVSKNNFAGQTLAYFSLDTETTIVSAEPAAWDIAFTRYTTWVDNENGGFMPYLVSGVLAGNGVEVVELNGIADAESINVNDYESAFSDDSLSIIGSDWKAYDFNSGWVLDAARVFLVKTVDGTIWRLKFIDFQGSSTGVITIEQKNLGTLSSIQKPVQLQALAVFPNPARTYATVAFPSLESADNANIQLIDQQGRVVFQQIINIRKGLNAIELDLNQYASGVYILNISVSKVSFSKSLIIN